MWVDVRFYAQSKMSFSEIAENLVVGACALLADDVGLLITVGCADGAEIPALRVR